MVLPTILTLPPFASAISTPCRWTGSIHFPTAWWGFASDGTTEVYNATESKLAGIPRSIVLGWSYFAETAQCMNNFMVAQRFEDEPEIDDVIEYVLTLRMRPTPVRLRLLKTPSCARRYVLIQR